MLTAALPIKAAHFYDVLCLMLVVGLLFITLLASFTSSFRDASIGSGEIHYYG